MGLLDFLKGSATVQTPGKSFPPRPARTASSSWKQTPTLSPGGQVDIVGEARHQDYLEELACGRDNRGCRVRCFGAELVREPENAYDTDAVRVDIGGRAVGYISRDAAPDYHDLIEGLWSRGELATCGATLTGGWVRPGDRGRIGVSLDIADEPRETSEVLALIPWGPRVAVTCEEHYAEALAAILGSDQRRTLAVIVLVERESNPYKPTQPGPSVAVQIGGADAGYLTPAMAKRFLPLVRQFARDGVDATCGGSLKRTEKRIEVRLEMAHPDHLGLPPAA